MQCYALGYTIMSLGVTHHLPGNNGSIHLERLLVIIVNNKLTFSNHADKQTNKGNTRVLELSVFPTHSLMDHQSGNYFVN